MRDLADRLERFEDCPLPYDPHHAVMIYPHTAKDWASAVEAMPEGLVTIERGMATYTAALQGLRVQVRADFETTREVQGVVSDG